MLPKNEENNMNLLIDDDFNTQIQRINREKNNSINEFNNLSKNKSNNSSFELKEEINLMVKTYSYVDEKSREQKKLTIDNFTILKVIGTGSFGKVLLVSKKDDNKIYAMKILKKKQMIIKNKILQTKNERKLLETLEHPFLLKLKYAFQNDIKLYLLTDYCGGGELFYHIDKVGNFNEDAVRFYASQVILALEYLHSKGIFYRE